MSLMSVWQNIDTEQIREWLERYESYGPIPGILAPMSESFFPILPLVAFLVANANAYGPLLGFLYSWIGVSIGSIIIFLLFRYFGHRLTEWIERRYPRTRNIFDLIEKKGFMLIFVLSCIPFTPSFLINIISGLTTVSKRSFISAILAGKAVMIAIITLASYDLLSFAQKPWKIALAVSVLFILWMTGTALQRKYRI